jgi:hypothetical protein
MRPLYSQNALAALLVVFVFACILIATVSASALGLSLAEGQGSDPVNQDNGRAHLLGMRGPP